MGSVKDLLARNEEWAESVMKQDPTLFQELAQGQEPNYLWIGCADSRVPSNMIVDVQPGELFVHRNIANVVAPTDLNVLSVIQYAVDVLEVENIVVCGHYGCGGVKAAMEQKDHGLIEHWLGNIKRVYEKYKDELDEIEDEQEKHDRYCELNVIEQVANVAQTNFVQNAWQNNRKLQVHGLIYSLETGRLKDLEVSVSGNS
jgi:carbonic anhydrase